MDLLAILWPPYRRAAALIGQARAARAQARHGEAAALYETALRLRPRQARWQVQAGHMRKEAGELAAAERHYRAAQARMPHDADVALQLERLRHHGWLSGQTAGAAALFGAALADPAIRADPTPAAAFDGLAPELAPRAPADLVRSYRAQVEIRRLGRRESGAWGVRPTLRGVAAVRGVGLSATPLVELMILLNGLAIHRASIDPGHALPFAAPDEPLRKYVFNVWLDFAGFARGLHAFEVRLIDAEGASLSFHDQVVIADPRPEAASPGSDALVTVDPRDPRPVETQVRARPSIVRPARRLLFPDGVHSVLVLRTDQLGDLVASIPALERLRALLPGARIVGLLTDANAALARTLDLFDEVIVVDFPDDPVERRRLMPLAEQRALRARLAPYAFDIAIDLAASDVSRALLRLSGARLLHGFDGGDWPWLDDAVECRTPDPWNGLESAPHAAKVLALIEALGARLGDHARVIRRPTLTRELLVPFGVDAGERFVLLHAGARIAFSRWPGFAALAEALLERTGLTVVLMTEEEGLRATLPPALLASLRFLLIDRRPAFDAFDAFVSFATVVVGNDSGPKHLAALRGTNVVTLFSARVNWGEWGQEEVGSIVSRRVPCAGCAIFHDAEECGKDFACIRDIKVAEVLDAVLAYL